MYQYNDYELLYLISENDDTALILSYQNIFLNKLELQLFV